MNSAQNEKKAGAKKKVKRLATVQTYRNLRAQQRGGVKRGAAAGANLRPLKKELAKTDASVNPKGRAKTVVPKQVGRPKVKVPAAEHDDSDASSVTSARSKRAPAKSKAAEDDDASKKPATRADSADGEAATSKKGKGSPVMSTPAGPVVRLKSRTINKLAVAKNNIQKNNTGILKYFSKAGAAKVTTKKPAKTAKSKWIVTVRGEDKALPVSRRSQGSSKEESADATATPKKTSKKRKADDAGLEETSKEQEEEEEEEEMEAETSAEVKAAPTVPPSAEVTKKSVVKRLPEGINPRVTRSLGDRVLRNGKKSKVKKSVNLPDLKKPKKAKPDEDIKSPSREPEPDSELEVDDQLESESGAKTEQPVISDSDIPVLTRVSKGVEETEPVDAKTSRPKPASEEEDPVLTRIAKSPEDADHVEPKAAVAVVVAVTTPLSPVSPMANSILSNKNFTDTNSNVCTNSVKENRKPPESQTLKSVDTILSDIHTDWDSDDEAQDKAGRSPQREMKAPFGDTLPAQVTKENEAPKYNTPTLNKGPSRQVVASITTPPLLDSDKPKIEDKPDRDSPTETSRNIGMKMPPTTECLLKAKETNGFADSVELLAKRSPKIDFELLRRRTKRSMSLNMDPSEKNIQNKTPPWQKRENYRAHMPKLSPEVDLSQVRTAKVLVQTTLSDKFVPKSEELFDTLIARTKDSDQSPSKETDSHRPDASPEKGANTSATAPNGTCEDEGKKDMSIEEAISSTPLVSASTSPVPAPELEPVIPTLDKTCLEKEFRAYDDASHHNLETSACSEKKEDDFSLHITLDSNDENSQEKLTDSDAVKVPSEDNLTEPTTNHEEINVLDQDENSLENIPLSPPKLKPFDSDSLVDEEEAMVPTPPEALKEEETIAEPAVLEREAPIDIEREAPIEIEREGPIEIEREAPNEAEEEEPIEMEEEAPIELGEEAPIEIEEEAATEMEKEALVADQKEDENSNSSELSVSYIQKLIEANKYNFSKEALEASQAQEEIEPNDNYQVSEKPEAQAQLEPEPRVQEEVSAIEEDSKTEEEPKEEGSKSELNVMETADTEECAKTEEYLSLEPVVDSQETPGEEAALKADLEGEETIPTEPIVSRAEVRSSATVESGCKETSGSSASSLSSILDADTTRLSLDLNLADIERKRREIFEEEESPEKRAFKEHVLKSLGLQSLRSVAEAAAAAAAAAAGPSGSGSNRSAKRAQRKDSGGTSSGRLKMVINVPKENQRKPLRILFKNGKPHPSHPEAMPQLMPVQAAEVGEVDPNENLAVLPAEGNAIPDPALLNLADSRPNSTAPCDGSLSVSTVDADGKSKQPGSLVIPEKSSSFSIHPGRLCSDVCSYCFGKFGSLDTPCHIAQLKSRERQIKILAVETQLAMDSCLCDACIRYVDRKANCPSYKPPGGRREKNKYSGSQAICCVNGCQQSARHSLRKKWYFKIKKSVVTKCPVNFDLVNSQLPLPLCPEHYSYMDYFMVCGLCKRRLTRSHMYNLTEVREINICLEADGIPARLSDKLFVCKLCRYYATLRVKNPRSQVTTLSNQQRDFIVSYRKRILRNHDIAVSGSEGEGDGDGDPDRDPDLPKDRSVSPVGEGSTSAGEEQPKGKRRRARSNPTPPSLTENLVAVEAEAPKKKARTSGTTAPKTKDASDTASERTDAEKSADASASNKPKNQPPLKLCLTSNSQSRSAEWVRKDTPPFFPGEDQLALHANIQFQSDDVPSEQRDWERCTSTLQFDKETKRLWQELQRPYGSQSSFLRHLVLMERYWRQGELVLTSTTDRAASYTRSVQNRLKAYSTTFVSKKQPPAQPTPLPAQTPSPAPPAPPASAPPPPASTVTAQAKSDKRIPTGVEVTPAPVAAPLPPPKPQPPVAIQPKPQPKPSTKPQAKTPSKPLKILPKPSSSWEAVGVNPSNRSSFFVSSAPVVNLTSSVSLTAVPAMSAPANHVPDLHPLNSDPVAVARTGRAPSWSPSPSGNFVSIVPSPSNNSPAVRVCTSSSVSASITPIYPSTSVSRAVTMTTSSASSVSPSLLPGGSGMRIEKAVANQANKSQHLVQVTAGGKSFSLTIAQFKKLQALRQQRQLDQQKKVRRPSNSGKQKRRASISNLPGPIPIPIAPSSEAGAPLHIKESPTASPDIICTEKSQLLASTQEEDTESFVPMICNVRSVTSDDQAITMWDETERIGECKPGPQIEITPVEQTGPVLPKISDVVTVTPVGGELAATATTFMPPSSLIPASPAVPVSVTASAPVAPIVPMAPILPTGPGVTLHVVRSENQVAPFPPALEIVPAPLDILPN